MRLFSSMWDMWSRKPKSSWSYFRDQRLHDCLKRKERGKEQWGEGGRKKERERKKTRKKLKEREKQATWLSGTELLRFNRLRQSCSLQNHFWMLLPTVFLASVLELFLGGTDFSLGTGSFYPFSAQRCLWVAGSIFMRTGKLASPSP